MSVKSVGGRPQKYKTRKDVVRVINAYFEVVEVGEMTVTGLALLFGSKQLLNDYENRKEFKDIIREAKLIIENDYELSLRKNGKTTDIFALKNFGWKDSKEITAKVKYTDDTDEELASRIRMLTDEPIAITHEDT